MDAQLKQDQLFHTPISPSRIPFQSAINEFHHRAVEALPQAIERSRSVGDLMLKTALCC